VITEDRRDKTRLAPPPTTRRQKVSDEYHGDIIEDPFRWLENGADPEVMRWTATQNEYCGNHLGSRPELPIFTERIRRCMSARRWERGVIRGGRLFYTQRREGRNQSELRVARWPAGELRPTTAAPDCDIEGRTLVDPNQLDRRGLVSLDWWYPSPDGKYLAYGLSWGGDEWSTLYVMETDSGRNLRESIERARYTSIAWKPDSSAFYYTRYPQPGTVPPGEENYHRNVFHHALGDDPARDRPVFGQDRPSDEMYDLALSEDGRWLLVTVRHGWNRSDLFVRDEFTDGAGFEPLVEGTEALFDPALAGSRLYLLTNHGAPRYRVLSLDLTRAANGKRQWEEVVPEDPQLVLQSIRISGDRLVVSALRDAAARLFVHNPDGTGVGEVQLPAEGTITYMSSEPSSRHAFLTFESFVLPPRIYCLDTEKAQLSAWPPGDESCDSPLSNIVVRREFYRSSDGTRIPLWILHHRDIVPEERPAVLTGYGGFNISMSPRFTPHVYPWLEAGGIYALANLRGGSEYGEDWHRTGMLQLKQNVFDDFVGAVEHLIEERYTAARLLGISGRSNGGLLVGAALTQRPDLFAAVFCGVPLLDMLRYHKSLIARLWIPEYGSAEDPEQYRWLRAYSPYHHVTPGTAYPAVLFVTASRDSRVDPFHARKMTALLQQATSSDLPILLRVEEEAGHGAGKPLDKTAGELAQMWTFFAWQLGLEIG